MKVMNHESGFTVTEFCIALAMLLAAGFFVYSQWQYAAMSNRDNERKTAINSMHYYLTEVHLPKNGGFPLRLSEETVPGLDANFLQDPSGRKVAGSSSDFRYEPGECSPTACKRYTLRANLEKEADFIQQGTTN